MASQWFDGEVSEMQCRAACTELNNRLRAGEAFRAEDIFSIAPGLAEHTEFAVDGLTRKQMSPKTMNVLQPGYRSDILMAFDKPGVYCVLDDATTPAGSINTPLKATASVEGVADSPYVAGTPHHFVGLHTTKSAVPVLWWRSVGHSHTAFVMETMVDALAAAAGQDPVAYRRRLLKGSPRHLGALDLAVSKAGAPPPKGQFRGVAVHHSFESYVAQVADVSVDKGKYDSVVFIENGKKAGTAKFAE